MLAWIFRHVRGGARLSLRPRCPCLKTPFHF
nr:MAG TPA: hypothetical protein [Caudoviricetes sp.]